MEERFRNSGYVRVDPCRSRAILDLRNRPAGMFADQRLGVTRSSFQARQCGAITHVAQGHADISQEPTAFGAKHGRVGEAFPEHGIIEGEKFNEVRRSEIGAKMLFHKAAFVGKSIPWANGEAIIAAIDAISNAGAKLLRDWSFEL